MCRWLANLAVGQGSNRSYGLGSSLEEVEAYLRARAVPYKTKSYKNGALVGFKWLFRVQGRREEQMSGARVLALLQGMREQDE